MKLSLFIKKHKLLVFVLVFVILFFIWGSFPRKYAVTEPKKDNSVFIKNQTATISPWKIIDKTLDKHDVWLSGEYPNLESYAILTGDNTYICYGTYIDDYDSPAGTCLQFKSTDWDILYPVKRNTLLPYPKSYLCNFDYFDLLI